MIQSIVFYNKEKYVILITKFVWNYLFIFSIFYLFLVYLHNVRQKVKSLFKKKKTKTHYLK